VAQRASEFVKVIATHFALLIIHSRRPSMATLNELPPSILLDAVVLTLQMENRDRAKCVGEVLDTMLSVFESSYKDDKLDVSSMPFWSDFADRIRALCSWCATFSYNFLFRFPLIFLFLLSREWYNKAGGVWGVSYLLQKMHVTWLRKNQVSFISSLLYLIRDLTPSMSVATSEDAVQTLLTLVKICSVKGNPTVRRLY